MLNRRSFTIIVLISLGYVATDIYLPSLPALATYFNATDNDVQRTLFAYLFSFSLTPLIFGPLSDNIGRKKVILIGIVISMMATLGCLFAQSITWMIVARFFQGIGMGAVLISSRAIQSDLFVGKELAKQITFVTMLLPLILAIAPTVGGILQEEFGWQSVFIFLICYLLAVFFLALFKTESLKAPSGKNVLQSLSTYKLHLKNRLFLSYGFNLVLPSFGIFGYLTVSPFLFQEIIGLSPAEYGALALFIGGAIVFASFANFKLLNIFSAAQLILIGTFLMLGAGLLLLLFHFLGILTTWSLLIPTMLYFTCIPLCASNAAAKAMSLIKNHFGAGTALITTFQFLMGALGSFVFTIIPNETFLSLAVCFICVGLLALVNLLYAWKLEKTYSTK